MKIRCEQDSIRLRLRKSEIELISSQHALSTAVRFPNGQMFSWKLILDPEKPQIEAHFNRGEISIHIPLQMAKDWISSENVGLSHQQFISPGHHLYVLVEKDFPCKDRPDEDKADYFGELAEKVPPLC